MTQIVEVDAKNARLRRQRQFVIVRDGKEIGFLIRHQNIHTHRHQGWVLGPDGSVIEATWVAGATQKEVVRRVLELVS